MNVIITIRGREAIPVRAIPFATGFRVSPDALCEALAHDSPTGLPILWDATAYQLDEYGNPVALWPKDWDEVASDVAAVSEELDAEIATGNSRKESWKARSTLALPAGCFMWLDELRESFRRGESRWKKDRKRVGDGEIQLYPPKIPEGLRWEDVMEGFERFIQSPPSETPLPAADPAPVADPTPVVPPLTAEPSRAHQPEGPLIEERLKVIAKAVSEKGYKPNAIPDEGKGVIRQYCLEDTKLFTGPTFDAAWKEAGRRGIARLLNADKFTPREKRKR